MKLIKIEAEPKSKLDHNVRRAYMLLDSERIRAIQVNDDGRGTVFMDGPQLALDKFEMAQLVKQF